MRYLAKVHTKSGPSATQLQLLAANVAEHIWEPITPYRAIATHKEVPFNEQALVLVDLVDEETVIAIQDATDWVMGFVSEYLTQGLTPKGLEEEVERAEQWRQSLTLQSQEVRRRALETAARRDEIQNLEKRMKTEREALESRD